ncbi:MAG: 5-(carboxyamino)imidazole ribonucleotide synthase, partial [Betaproteobacteria bacterium]
MTELRSPLPPGSWLGVLGGGQLGRMFTHAAQALGYRVCSLDLDEDGPAGSVADRHLRADYLDPAALDELGSLCAAVTTEFENVPAAALQRLAARCFVSPAARCVAVAQDRIDEKSFIAGQGIP